VSTADLAAAGSDLYVLGTAPAGGSAKSLAVATRSAAGDWSTAPLPDDLVALQQRHPGQVAIGQLHLAAKDATHLVAVVTVNANLDPQQLRPELKDQNVMTTWTDTGLDVRRLPDCNAEAPRSTDPQVIKQEAAGCRDTVKDDQDLPVVAHYSYDQLGIDPELRSLVGGRTFAYASDDGHTFQSVDLPSAERTYPAGIVAMADGYHLVVSDAIKGATSTVLSSADGHSWTADGTLSGSAQSVGALGGHLAVATITEQGTTDVQVRQTDGTWHALGLAGDVPTPANGSAYVGDIAFGPLGMAATAGSFKDKDGGGPAGTYVLHSSDGSTVSVEDIGAAIGSPKTPVGVIVTADAIAVRLSDPSPDSGKPGHVPTQTVLVGTPAG
jgi:hypothetical protein